MLDYRPAERALASFGAGFDPGRLVRPKQFNTVEKVRLKIRG